MPHISLPENLPGIIGPMTAYPETAKPLNAFEIESKVAALKQNKKSEIKSTNLRTVPGKTTVLIDFVLHEISYSSPTVGAVRCKLTPTEFKLFCLLYENSNVVVSREKIVAKLWNKKAISDSHRIVDKHLATLRKKSSQNIFKIEAVHGKGYRMTLNEDLYHYVQS